MISFNAFFRYGLLSFRLMPGLIFILLLSGCADDVFRNNRTPDAFRGYLDSAQQLLDSNPAQALVMLHVVDSVWGRSRFPDSIRFQEISLRARALRQTGFLDSGFNVLLKGFESALLHRDSLSQVKYLFEMGQWKWNEGSLRVAVPLLKRGVSIGDRHLTKEELAPMLELLGQALIEQGEYVAAKQYLLNARLIFDKVKDTVRMSTTLNSLGNMYAELGEKEAAMQAYRESLDLITAAGDSVRMATVMGNIGVLIRPTNQDSAFHYYAEARRLTSAPRYIGNYIKHVYNTANLHYDRKEYDRAMEMYDSVLSLCRAYKIMQGLPRVYGAYGSVAIARNDFSSADRFLSEAVRLSDSLGHGQLSHLLMTEQLDLYEKSRDFDRFLSKAKAVNQLRDSLMNIDKQSVMKELEMNFRMERTDEKIAALQLELKSRKWQLFFLGILTLSLAALVFFYRRQKRALLSRNRSYERLMEQYRVGRDGPSSDNTTHHEVTAEKGEKLSPLPEADESGLNHELRQIHSELVQLFTRDRIFTNPELRVEDLADRIGVSARKVSQALKAVEGVSFNQFLNKHRIAEATRLMETSDGYLWKIEAIGEQCGFNSRQYFQKVFEQVTGVTPGFYRNSIQERRKSA